MKNSKKYRWLYIILGIVIVFLVVIASWMLGKDSGSKSRSTQSVEVVKQKVAQKSSVAPSTVKETAPSQPTASSSPNIAFGKEIDSDEFLVLAYCKKWDYSLSDFMNNASEDDAVEMIHDDDIDNFHGTVIGQGTGDSLCELNGTTNTTITISGGDPVAQDDFHNITYNKQDLIHQFLNSQDDVQTLQTLTNTLIGNHQANQANTDNDNDD